MQLSAVSTKPAFYKAFQPDQPNDVVVQTVTQAQLKYFVKGGFLKLSKVLVDQSLHCLYLMCYIYIAHSLLKQFLFQCPLYYPRKATLKISVEN